MDHATRTPVNRPSPSERHRSLVIHENDVVSGRARPCLRLYWDGEKLAMEGSRTVARNVCLEFPDAASCADEEQAERVIIAILTGYKGRTAMGAAFE